MIAEINLAFTCICRASNLQAISLSSYMKAEKEPTLIYDISILLEYITQGQRFAGIVNP